MTASTRDEDRRQIERFYHERLRRFGPQDARCVGFTRVEQRKRFDALLELGDFDRHRLLDVGCGLGDLLPHLLEHGVRPFYSGLDLCPEMIARSRARFRARPDVACHFEVGSLLEHEPPAPYDFVVASGVFGHYTANALERIGPSLERLFGWCTVGLAVNFLSLRAPRYEAERLYVDPSEILNVALRLTPAVRIRHDYLPDDFTVFLYRETPWQRARERLRPSHDGHSNGHANGHANGHGNGWQRNGHGRAEELG